MPGPAAVLEALGFAVDERGRRPCDHIEDSHLVSVHRVLAHEWKVGAGPFPIRSRCC